MSRGNCKSILLPAELHEAVGRAAKASQTPQSHVVWNAIVAYLGLDPIDWGKHDRFGKRQTIRDAKGKYIPYEPEAQTGE